MVFHWSLSDSKSPRVSRILLSILVVFNNAVVWMVSSRPPISKSSRPFNNPLVTVPKAPIIIGTFVIFMFHNFFNSQARSRYLSFFSHSFSLFCDQPRLQIRHYYNYLLLSSFYISVSWWFFTGVWVTTSLLKSPGLVSGFWPFFAMLSFG